MVAPLLCGKGVPFSLPDRAPNAGLHISAIRLIFRLLTERHRFAKKRNRAKFFFQPVTTG